MGSNAKKTTFRLRVKDNRFLLLLSSGFGRRAVVTCVYDKYSEVFFCCLLVHQTYLYHRVRHHIWCYFILCVYRNEIQPLIKKTLLLLWSLLLLLLKRPFFPSHRHPYLYILLKMNGRGVDRKTHLLLWNTSKFTSHSQLIIIK